MAESSIEQPRRLPAWIWPVVVLLVALEPALHLWVAHAPPEGMVPSGLHTLGAYVYLGSMKHCADGFYSPYAAPDNPHRARHHSFHPLPYHWMYGGLGVLARLFGVTEFIFLGFAHGAGMALFRLHAGPTLLRLGAAGPDSRRRVWIVAQARFPRFIRCGAAARVDRPVVPGQLRRRHLRTGPRLDDPLLAGPHHAHDRPAHGHLGRGRGALTRAVAPGRAFAYN